MIRTALQLINCREVDGISVVPFTPGVRCYEIDHLLVMILSLFIVIGLTIIFPTFLWKLLRRVPNLTVEEKRQLKIEQSHGFIYLCYKLDWVSFELSLIARRTFLVFVFVFFYFINQKLEYILFMIAIVIKGIGHFRMQPFIRYEDNLIREFLLLDLTLVCFFEYGQLEYGSDPLSVFDIVEIVLLIMPISWVIARFVQWVRTQHWHAFPKVLLPLFKSQ